MNAYPELIRVRVEHQPIGNAPDYHEWITAGERLLLDSRGRRNPRMWGPTNWTRWRCNNTDCPAEAVVADQLIETLLDRAAPAPEVPEGSDDDHQ